MKSKNQRKFLFHQIAGYALVLGIAGLFTMLQTEKKSTQLEVINFVTQSFAEKPDGEIIQQQNNEHPIESIDHIPGCGALPSSDIPENCYYDIAVEDGCPQFTLQCKKVDNECQTFMPELPDGCMFTETDSELDCPAYKFVCLHEEEDYECPEPNIQTVPTGCKYEEFEGVDGCMHYKLKCEEETPTPPTACPGEPDPSQLPDGCEGYQMIEKENACPEYIPVCPDPEPTCPEAEKPEVAENCELTESIGADGCPTYNISCTAVVCPEPPSANPPAGCNYEKERDNSQNCPSYILVCEEEIHCPDPATIRLQAGCEIIESNDSECDYEIVCREDDPEVPSCDQPSDLNNPPENCTYEKQQRADGQCPDYLLKCEHPSPDECEEPDTTELPEGCIYTKKFDNSTLCPSYEMLCTDGDTQGETQDDSDCIDPTLTLPAEGCKIVETNGGECDYEVVCEQEACVPPADLRNPPAGCMYARKRQANNPCPVFELQCQNSDGTTQTATTTTTTNTDGEVETITAVGTLATKKTKIVETEEGEIRTEVPQEEANEETLSRFEQMIQNLSDDQLLEMMKRFTEYQKRLIKYISYTDQKDVSETQQDILDRLNNTYQVLSERIALIEKQLTD